MIWVALPTELLQQVKTKFEEHVRVLSKDMSDMEDRCTIDEILCHMEQIDTELNRRETT